MVGVVVGVGVGVGVGAGGVGMMTDTTKRRKRKELVVAFCKMTGIQEACTKTLLHYCHDRMQSYPPHPTPHRQRFRYILPYLKKKR